MRQQERQRRGCPSDNGDGWPAPGRSGKFHARPSNTKECDRSSEGIERILSKTVPPSDLTKHWNHLVDVGAGLCSSVRAESDEVTDR